MIVLDLFCGTKSLKTVIEKIGYEYIGLDIEEKFNPDICIDFLEWDYKSIVPDILWASPDCAVYSMLGGGRHFGKDREPKTEKAKIQLKLLKKLKECINYYLCVNPNLIFFIENPTARMVWFINEYPRYDLSYCKYGFNRMKPTTIWTNKPNFVPKKCKNSNPDCHHLKTPRGCRTHGTQAINKTERYKVPIDLLTELFTF